MSMSPFAREGSARIELELAWIRPMGLYCTAQEPSATEPSAR
jgi:hypothetical protein